MKWVLILAFLGNLPNLETIKNDIDSVRSLQSRGVMPANESQQYENRLLAQASLVAKEPVDYTKLSELTVSKTDRFLRFFTFTRIISIFAGFIFSVAIIALGAHYLVDIVRKIPPKAYEALAYGISFGLIFLGNYLDPDYQIFSILPGCLILIGAFALTENIRNLNFSINNYAFFCLIVWMFVAIKYDDSFIGFLAIAMLFVTHLSSTDSDRRSVYMGASLGAYLFIVSFLAEFGHWNEVDWYAFQRWHVFQLGAKFFGVFGYCGSMMFLCSKYFDQYPDRFRARYWISQVVYSMSLVGIIFLGVMTQVEYLINVGVIFLALYLLHRYLELPWRGIGWAWASLGLAGLSYGFVLFAQSYPFLFPFLD